MQKKFPKNKKYLEVVCKGWPMTPANTTIKFKGVDISSEISWFKMEAKADDGIIDWGFGLKTESRPSFRKLWLKWKYFWFDVRFKLFGRAELRL